VLYKCNNRLRTSRITASNFCRIDPIQALNILYNFLEGGKIHR